MFFSVLVPVYNAEPYLKDCLDSVLRQSEQDLELILVNDGSVDGGGMLCDRYRALYPGKVKVLHQSNKGLISARRAGIAAAEGEFCVFLDADDTLEPEALATIRETLEREHADIVIFNYYNRYEPEFTTAVAEAVFADNAVFRGEAEKKPVYAEMIASTTQLNSVGHALAKDADVHAITDVTGFGLLGHGLEMARGSDATLVVDMAALPFLKDAAALAQQGCVTGASHRNWASYGGSVALAAGLADWQRHLLTDPQTSGGLLVACAPERADDLLKMIVDEGYPAARIVGRVVAGPPAVRIDG